jgi:two-component system, chemotaxis family, sensor kinase Cph1
VAALERLTETFGEASGVHVDLEAQLGDSRLAPEVETTLYRIVQEALTNVVKHAGAANVSILLVRREAAAMLVIEDDGQGFTVEDAREDGLGLAGMRERVALHDGRLLIESRRGGGTTLAVEVPL